MKIVPTLTADAVQEGSELPEFRYPVTASTVVLGALANRDWRPMHHDRDFAIERNGVKDIFLNTPTQAGWFEHYLFAWAGPGARLGKMRFTMKSSIFPGARMRFSGRVVRCEADTSGDWVWVDLELAIHVDDGVLATACEARLAVPVDADFKLWFERGERWNPCQGDKLEEKNQ